MQNNYTFLKECEKYNIKHPIQQEKLNTQTTVSYNFITPHGTWKHTEPAPDPSKRAWSTNVFKLRQADVFINQLIAELEDRNAGSLHTIFETDSQFVEVANKALDIKRR